MKKNISDSSCLVKYEIDPRILNKIYGKLNKKDEVAGVISFSKGSTNFGKGDRIEKTNEGKGASVSTPLGVINYHTHPVDCYIGEGTVWGWPSGEDMRESIKFGLKGNRGHMVVCVEGIYTIQVSPCKLEKLRNTVEMRLPNGTVLTPDQVRGIIIFFIETYFKSLHGIRGLEDVNSLSQNHGIKIFPESWVDFSNKFTLRNLNILHKTAKPIIQNKNSNSWIQEDQNIKLKDGTSKTIRRNIEYSTIPHQGVPVVSDETNSKFGIKTVPIMKYISEDDLQGNSGGSNIFEVSSSGEDGQQLSLSWIKRNIMPHAKYILSHWDENCTKSWNNSSSNSWFWVKFYQSKDFTNEYFWNGNNFKSPTKQVTLKIEVPVYFKIFSNESQGCSVESLKKNLEGGQRLNKAPSSKTPHEFGRIKGKIKTEIITKGKKLIKKISPLTPLKRKSYNKKLQEIKSEISALPTIENSIFTRKIPLMVKQFKVAERAFLKDLPNLKNTMKTAERQRLIRNYREAKKYVNEKEKTYINALMDRKSLEKEKERIQKLLKSL